MLVNFFHSEQMDRLFSISLSHPHYPDYVKGLNRRFSNHRVSVNKLFIPTMPNFQGLCDLGFKRTGQVLKILFRLVLTPPICLYLLCRFLLFLHRKEIDILHINNGGYPGALSARVMALAGRLAGVPKIVMVVNNLAVGYKRFSRKLELPFDWLVKNSVHVFVTGSKVAEMQLRDTLSLTYGITLREVSEPRNDSRLRWGVQSTETTVFGIVALHEPRKGHRYLLEAVKLLSDCAGSKANFILLIEGSGSLEKTLKNLVVSSNLSHIVKFCGDVENIANFYQACDILVLSSVCDEDFPNVILEAMAFKKPVIGTMIAGIPEQIDHGHTGLLVPPRDVEALGSAMEFFLESKECQTQFGLAALRAFNAKFKSEVSVAKYCALYFELLEYEEVN